MVGREIGDVARDIVGKEDIDMRDTGGNTFRYPIECRGRVEIGSHHCRMGGAVADEAVVGRRRVVNAIVEGEEPVSVRRLEAQRPR
jgi:hypothetical protein